MMSYTATMKLADWMKQEGLTQTEAGRRLGIRQGHVSDLVNGRFWPSRALAAKIWRVTNGAVTPTDFLTDEERGENVAEQANGHSR
jgi:transcriptional regulator with XRE-family HTH domain